MWFSPLKGAHLTLSQIDKTLPVEAGAANVGIKRGSFVCVGTNGGFKLYDATDAANPKAIPYIALQDYNDFQAGMAGGVGTAPVAAGAAVGAAPTGNDLLLLDKPALIGGDTPRITAISGMQPGEYQTSNIDASSTYAVGDALTVGAGGVLVPYPAAGGKNIVGYVTEGVKTRWVNDLGASANGARISGGNVDVIAFTTAWIPAATANSNPVIAASLPKPDKASK